MRRHKWKVWYGEYDDDDFIPDDCPIIFEGSYTKALKVYKKSGGEKAGYHLGYDL